MLDLFRQIDKDNSGMIDNKELKAGLEKIIATNGPLPNPQKAAPAAADAPPASPRAAIEQAKALDAEINPPVAAE
jgi:hypothetical protein